MIFKRSFQLYIPTQVQYLGRYSSHGNSNRWVALTQVRSLVRQTDGQTDKQNDQTHALACTAWLGSTIANVWFRFYASTNNSRRRALCFRVVRPAVRCPLTPTGWPKIGTIFMRLNFVKMSNINRFSKLFHYQNQKKICNNTTKDLTTSQVCRYITLWNV